MTLVYPFDYARVLLAADALKPAGQRKFKGTFDAIVKGLPRPAGNGPHPFRRTTVLGAYLGIVVHRALYFGLYDTLKLGYSNNGGSDLSFLLRCAFAQVSKLIYLLEAGQYT